MTIIELFGLVAIVIVGLMMLFAPKDPNESWHL